MCDTFVATGDWTASGNIIFGKNSDREPNEAQALVQLPRAGYDLKRDPDLQVTFIRVPQVRETHAVLLCKPFQMWGAEMGANEFGLVIGNEALFTKVRLAKQNQGLTGMDMLRIALERCRTAGQALQQITDLIANYSQDACGGYTDRSFYYHSSFIIADPTEAYVLESAGHQWAAVRVRGYRAISNGITIEGDYDYASPDLIAFARRQGWLKAGRDFNFRECYSDLFFTYFSQCRYRQAHSTDLGRAAAGKLDVAGAFAILRDHGTQGPAPAPDNLDRPTGSHFEGRRASMKALCVHASGLTAPSQTTGSMVAELRPQSAAGDSAPATIWCTGTAAPCLSLFKPCFVSGEIARPFPGPDSFLQPGARADDSLWWRHERVHRAALETSYSQVAAVGLARRAELEQGFVNREREMFARANRPAAAELDRFSRECFAAGDAALDDWTGTLGLDRKAGRPASTDVPAISRTGRGLAPLYRRYRRKLDRAAGFSFTPRSGA